MMNKELLEKDKKYLIDQINQLIELNQKYTHEKAHAIERYRQELKVHDALTTENTLLKKELDSSKRRNKRYQRFVCELIKDDK